MGRKNQINNHKLTQNEYKPFKMKGHTLPGINQNSETPNLPDGKSASSPFQKKSPNKWVQAVAQLAPMVMGMFGKKKEEKE